MVYFGVVETATVQLTRGLKQAQNLYHFVPFCITVLRFVEYSNFKTYLQKQM